MNPMRPKIVTRGSTRDDIGLLLPKLRGADREEWMAGGIDNPRPMLEMAVDMAVSDPMHYVTRTTWRGTEPMFMFGVCPVKDKPEVGSVWMVANEDAERYAVALHKRTKKELMRLYHGPRYQMLYADTYEGNFLHHRWLEWMGFEKKFLFPFGPDDRTFIHYERKA